MLVGDRRANNQPTEPPLITLFDFCWVFIQTEPQLLMCSSVMKFILFVLSLLHINIVGVFVFCFVLFNVFVFVFVFVFVCLFFHLPCQCICFTQLGIVLVNSV